MNTVQAAWQQVLTEAGDIKVANLVTLSRAALILPVFWLLLQGLTTVALMVYVTASVSDLLDGWLARRAGRASNFGAQLDAAVDNLWGLATLLFLWLAFPGLMDRHRLAIVVLFGGPLLYLGVSYLLRSEFLMFHFWSAKVGAVLLVCLWPLMALTGSETIVPIAAWLVGLSRLEQVVFILRGGRNLNAPHGLGRIDA